MKKVLISVIVPCYNVEKYLSRCLDSILNQSFSDFEIICVEDCSSDKTKYILEKYEEKHKKIHVVYNKKNQGLAVSRNIGIDKSNGEYIYFIDSDDTISDYCLEILYTKIKQDKTDLVIGGIKPYPENKKNDFCINRSKFLQNWVKFKSFTKLQITTKNSYQYYDDLYCCAVNKLYKKDFLQNNNIRFINKKCFHEDNGFWLKILACNPLISGISTKTYFYLIRNQSITDKMDSDAKIHITNLKQSLNDAYIFAKEKRCKKLSSFIYFEKYLLTKHRLFYFVWTNYERRLKILSYPIFGLKFDKNKKRYKLKVLGIPVFVWRTK